MLVDSAVTVADVCEILRTSHATLYRYIKVGRSALILEGTS